MTLIIRYFATVDRAARMVQCRSTPPVSCDA